MAVSVVVWFFSKRACFAHPSSHITTMPVSQPSPIPPTTQPQPARSPYSSYRPPSPPLLVTHPIRPTPPRVGPGQLGNGKRNKMSNFQTLMFEAVFVFVLYRAVLALFCSLAMLFRLCFASHLRIGCFAVSFLGRGERYNCFICSVCVGAPVFVSASY